jgi:hypothetical protein
MKKQPIPVFYGKQEMFVLGISFVLLMSLFASIRDVNAATFNVGSGQTYATIQDCVNAAQAGDTCLVHAGTYSGAVFPRSGEPGSRITVLADTGGSQPVVTSSFNFGSRSYITVDGFHMSGSAFAGNGCSFVAAQNNLVEKSGTGFSITCDDVLVSGNTFDLSPVNSYDVIRQWGDRWVIRDNVATGLVEDYLNNHLDFWQSWCNSDNNGADVGDFVLLEGNTMSDATLEDTGRDIHFFLIHATDSCSDVRTNYIIRYNKVRSISQNYATFDVDDSPGITGASVYNNVIGETYYGNASDWRDYTISGSGVSYMIANNNIFYDAIDYVRAEGVSVSTVSLDGSLAYDPEHTITTDEALQTCVNAGTCIINQNPLFTDYANDDFSLQTSPTPSPAIDAGHHLTVVNGSDSGSGTTLVVDNPYPFQDGWAGVEADWIAVGSVTNTVQISSINYNTNTITLASSISRNDGDPIWLYRDSDGTRVLYGSAPDIGAVEYEYAENAPPVRSNGLPDGELPAGTAQTTISLDTNEDADCRYSTTVNVDYSGMTEMSITGHTTHSAAISGLTDGAQYSYYIKCQDMAGSINPDDYVISFDVAGGSQTELRDNLEGLYYLDGNANDSSGNENHGAINGATYNSSGKYNGAYSFNGDDYITAGDQPELNVGTNSFSISSWIKTDGNGVSNDIILSKSAGPGTSNEGYFIDIDSCSGADGKLEFHISDGSSEVKQTSGIITNLCDDTWKHIVYVFDRSTNEASRYVDGVIVSGDPVDISSVTGLLDSSDQFCIGNLGTNCDYSTTYFDGLIDEVAIWQRALSAQEVSDIYNLGSSISVALAPSPTCSDGTALNTCASNPPFYCDGSGNLVENCAQCGCAGDWVCSAAGTSCEESSQTSHWGQNTQLGSATTMEHSRAMGGISPSEDNMKIDSISIYLGAQTGNIRLAVYSGGELDNPLGATLLWDAGTVNPQGVAGLYTINHPNGGVAWPKDTPTWLAWKSNTGVAVYYSGSSADAGHFQAVRGRNNNGFSRDPDTAFPLTYSDDGSFSNYWYSIYVDYSINIPTCSDGTALNTCASNPPFYCDGSGNLVENCAQCGCAGDWVCGSEGTYCVDRPDISNNYEQPVSYEIGWSTDIPATSQVEYGLSSSYGTLTPPDENLVTSHAV